MSRKRHQTIPASPGSIPDPGRSKTQRVPGCAKILLDIMKESSDCFPFLKSTLGFVSALIKHYEHYKDVEEKVEDLIPKLERFKRDITAAGTGGGRAGGQQSSEFSSALEEIEKRSRALLEKSTAARFMDKGEDSAEVARLIERLQEAITHYQISQQQTICDQIANLTSSFDTFLKLHEKSPVVKGKLHSVMARLDRLYSGDGDDALRDKSEEERRAKLFSTLRLIRDEGNALYNRINVQDYKECPGDILAVSGMAEDIRDALLEYQTTQQWAIYDQGCGLIITADLSVLNSCRRAPGAGYKHGDRKSCLRGTRETVLDEIELWIKDFNKSPIFWLNGLAGTGKSTISQTVSERAFADGLLGGSFFCSRNFGDRSDLRLIFPTLAFQLAHKYPAFRSVLVPLLQSNPDVVHESLYSQMGKLIVEPLRSAGVSTVLVIDALDECKDEEPSSAILSVLGRFVGQIPRVKFFITGRPEPRIKTGFRLPLLADSTDVFVLHDVHPVLINDDIRLFLKHELSELARRRRLDRWPSNEHVDLLCRRAAGLFVYAVATVKFLDAKTQLPKRRLEVIARLPESTTHEGKTRFDTDTTLDSLYTSILETAFGEDPEIYSKVRSTIGAVVLLANPLPPSGIAQLIGLDPEEVILFLTLVHSLLAIDEDSSQPVKPFHKSFPDFITDPSRCADARFYISPGNVHFELIANCLRVMNEDLKQDHLSLPDYASNSEVEDLQTIIEDRVSVALRYACQSWHHHLTKTGGDVTDILSGLGIFLKEKFLAWLEVVSVLGAAKGAIVALERLIPWIQEVAGDKKLLDTARDCFHFVTTFFEPINLSAAHIYHSALELCPLSSIVRRLYYHQRRIASSRVVAGTPDSWDERVSISNAFDRGSFTWSPCGQFVAVLVGKTVEIRDALSSQLVSTFSTKPDIHRDCGLAYSPDGRSLACLSDTLIIWDIQTGGVAKEIQCNASGNSSVVWSLDGGMIGMTQDSTVHVCCVTSGMIRSPGTLQSSDKLRIWAHDRSFRVMTTWQAGEVFTIEIFEVGSELTKTESFHIKPWGESPRIESFSPATYRISIWDSNLLCILDVRSSECLLEETGYFKSHCFSTDGSLFASSMPPSGVHIWKWNSGRYMSWRESTSQDWNSFEHSPLQFSPTSSSILGRFQRILRVYRLDSPSVISHPSGSAPLAILSPSGAYIATARKRGRTVTITSLLSQTTPQVIDTDMEISTLFLTGNVLLVLGPRVRRSTAFAAWQLTGQGLVDGVFGSRRAGRGDRIWAVSVPYQRFAVDDQVLVIKVDENIVHAYHAGTGKVLEPKTPPHAPTCWYTDWNMYAGEHYLRCHSPDEQGTHSEGVWPLLQTTLREGWVKDREGKHRLWIPIEWRASEYRLGRFPNITALWFTHHGRTVIVVL